MAEPLATVKAAAADVALRYLGVQGAIELRNRLIVEAYQAGVSQADLAAAAGLSPQRIHQLVYDQNGDDNESH
jgi:hypothetical protein